MYAAVSSDQKPKQLADLPCAQPALTSVTAAIKLAQSTLQSIDLGSSHLELELRMGQHAKNFRPGVPQRVFVALEKWFDTGDRWAFISDWHNIHAYFHGSAIPGDSSRIRTEVTFGSGDGVHTEHTQKDRVRNFDFCTLACDKTTETTDLRLALNVEHRVQQSRVPDDVDPTEVHIKCRKSYRYAPTNWDSPVWEYSLTKRWTGPTLTAAMEARKKSEPVFEVEIECIDPTYMANHDACDVAVKLLHKIVDVLSAVAPEYLDNTAYTIEPAQCRR